MLISGEKLLMSAKLKGCVTWFKYFLDLHYVRYNCAKFNHYRMCITDFREGVFLPPLYVSSPKRAILNRSDRVLNTKLHATNTFALETECKLIVRKTVRRRSHSEPFKNIRSRKTLDLAKPCQNSKTLYLWCLTGLCIRTSSSYVRSIYVVSKG